MLATIANHLWQSTLFIVVAGLLALALRKNAAQLRYWLWMIASLKFLVPFSLLIALGGQLELPQPVAEPGIKMAAPARWSDFAAVVALPAGDATNVIERATATPQKVATLNTQLIVLGAWAAGFFGVLLFWLIRWLRVHATVRAATPIGLPPGIAFDFPVPIKCAATQTEPGIVGILQPILLLPRGLIERLNASQLRAILAHERCHLERRDNLTAAVHMVIEAVFWFHPLVWWIGARLVEERELACDAAVLRAGNDPESYASGILDVCQHYLSTQMPCVAGVSGADLKKRVRAIMTHRGEARLQFAKTLLLASVGVAVLATPVLMGALLATRADAQSNASLNDAANKWPAIRELSIALSQSDTPLATALTIDGIETFATRNRTLRSIIAYAYGLQEGEIAEISAFTKDLASSRYNIVAKSAEPLNVGPEIDQGFRLMVRRLLVEQFGLQFHFDTQRTPVYALTLDPSHSGMKLAAAGDPGPRLARGVNSLRGFAAPMLLLKQYLSAQMGRPLLDQTGLTGRYNFNLKWGPEPGDADAPNASNVLQEPTREVLVDALQAQLGLSLVSQDGEVQRLVIDNIRQPSTLKPAPTEVAVDVAQFDSHVGHYNFQSGGRIISIYREGNQLFALLTGQPPLRIYAQSGDSYFAKSVAVGFRFNRGSDGATTGLAVTQGPQTILAPRMEVAAAKMREAALAKRIREKIPQPGTERAIWDYLSSLAADKPIYDRMTENVAAAVRAEWPSAKPRFEKLGVLQSIKHTSVGPIGADIYLATFEHGSTEWRVSLDDAGQIEILSYRRITAPQ